MSLNDVDAVMRESPHMVYSHLHTWMKSVWNNVEPGNFKKFKMLVSFLVKNVKFMKVEMCLHNFGLIIHFEFTFIRDFQLFQGYTCLELSNCLGL